MSEAEIFVAISWDGLPQYAARSIECFVQRHPEYRVLVLGTRTKVPIKGMEDVLSVPVIWLESNDQSITWGSLELPIPDFFVQSGWHIPCFNKLGKQVKQSGGRVVGMSDNNYKPGIRKYLGALRYRLFWKTYFDLMIVAGESGMRLMKFYGARSVGKGIYSADARLFQNGAPLYIRPKKMLYVGRFEERKNVITLVSAFRKFRESNPGWTLELAGSGPLKDQLTTGDGVIIHDFIQPEELPTLYQRARCFILASHVEHWGVVVHEAALSGCALLLSHAVGSREDFATSRNAILFDPSSETDMEVAMSIVANWSDAEWRSAQEDSVMQASTITVYQFSEVLSEFIAANMC